MADKQLLNPAGAYGYTALTDGLATSQSEFRTSTTVTTALTVVAMGTDGRVAIAATNGTASLCIGVALETAGAANGIIEVATSGFVGSVPCDGAVAAGDVLIRSGTTAGSVKASATPATGEAIGVAVAASASNVVTMYVSKGA